MKKSLDEKRPCCSDGRVLRVCFIGGQRLPPPLNPTAKKKYRCLATLAETYVVAFSSDLYPRRFDDAAHFYLLPKPAFAIARYALMFTAGTVVAAFLVLRHRIDLLIAQSPHEGLAAVCARRFARLLGRNVKVVVENHNDFEVAVFFQRRLWFPALYRVAAPLLARFTLRRADAIRVVSDSLRRRVESVVQGKPMFQFPTWTDIDVFLNVHADGSNHPATIIFVGVLIPRKCVHVLIAAFLSMADEYPEARLLILGDAINPEYREQLMRQKSVAPAGERISFVAGVPQSELARHMAAARVMVLPTVSEGLPRVVFEAMACGTPVIGSAVSGIPEVVEDGVNGFLVEPGNVAQLADRLRWVMAHPAECRQMGAVARSGIREIFSTERYREGYAAMYSIAR